MFTFPLLKPLKSQSDSELESQSDLCETLALVGAIAVMAGVGLEIIIVIMNPPYGYPFQRIGSLIADVFIGVGIIAEVGFGKRESRCQSELRKRSNAELARSVTLAGEANERAEEAKLETARLQAEQAPRILTAEKWIQLQSLRGYTQKVFITAVNNAEAQLFLYQIGKALVAAGIEVLEMLPRDSTTLAGFIFIFPDASELSEDDRFVNCFKAIGIEGQCKKRSEIQMWNIPMNGTIVMVGQKELKFSEEPYLGPPGQEDLSSLPTVGI